MKTLKYILSILLICLLSVRTLHAQVAAIIDLSKQSVYVQEPFRVNITVYTKTWFTAPLEFSNLQIPNAFIVPFDRTQPGMFTIGGKQYPGVQFYYIVFPYKVGEFSIPSLEITAQSPPEGSSTGQKIVIHTAIQKFTVRDIPNDKKSGIWLVAKDVTISEKWNADLNKLKVGDVIERTIIINAKGTLPQFIPDISEQQQVKWASIYPKTPILNDSKGGGDVNGQSTQTITYLLEKSGNFTLPEVHLSFWNPYASKMQERTLAEKKLYIVENPNLGILTTLQDSLQASISPKNQDFTKRSLLILGIPWYEFTGITLACLGILYLFIRIIIRILRKWKQYSSIYKQREEYLFKQFLKTDDKHLSEALYQWWDTLKQKPSASVSFSFEFLGKHKEANNLKEELTTYYLTGKITLIEFKKLITKLRKEVLKAKPKKITNEDIYQDVFNKF